MFLPPRTEFTIDNRSRYGTLCPVSMRLWSAHDTGPSRAPFDAAVEPISCL